MHNRRMTRWILAVFCVLLVGGLALASADRQASFPNIFFARGLDEAPVTAVNPVDNATWAVWAYRNGTEFDIALSILDESGSWSEPVFFGEGDGLDQRSPTLVFDHNGTAYLAYAVRETRQVFLNVKLIDKTSWTWPLPVAGMDAPASSPVLLVVREQLVLAVLSNHGITMIEMDLVNPVRNSLHGIQEGPDAIDPLGLTRDVDGRDESDQAEGGLHRRGTNESRGDKPTNLRSDPKTR